MPQLEWSTFIKHKLDEFARLEMEVQKLSYPISDKDIMDQNQKYHSRFKFETELIRHLLMWIDSVFEYGATHPEFKFTKYATPILKKVLFKLRERNFRVLKNNLDDLVGHYIGLLYKIEDVGFNGIKSRKYDMNARQGRLLR